MVNYIDLIADELKSIVDLIIKEKGDLVLCMVIKEIPEIEKYNIIFGGEWIEKSDNKKEEVYNYLVSLIVNKFVDKTLLKKISGVSAYSLEGEFIKTLIRHFSISRPTYFSQTKVGNIYLEEAVIVHIGKGYKFVISNTDSTTSSKIEY